MKTKDTKETSRAIKNMVMRKSRPKKFLRAHEGTKSAGEFKITCSTGRQLYSPLSKTKAAFADSTTRYLKNVFYPYMEDQG